jgi:hypothetical protein
MSATAANLTLAARLTLSFQEFLTGISQAGKAGKDNLATIEDGAKKSDVELKHLTDTTGKIKSGLGGLSSAFTGAFAVLSIGNVVNAGMDVLKVNEHMESSFKQSKLSGEALNTQLERTSQLADELEQKWLVDDARVKQVAASTALLGGVHGKTNDEITKLAVGIEKLSEGQINADLVARTFTRSLNDPEGKANLELLIRKYPQLGSALEGVTDPTVALQKATEAMAPGFASLEENAGKPLGKLESFKNNLEDAAKGAGTFIVTAAGPLLEFFGIVGSIVGQVATVFESVPAPIKTLTSVVLALVTGLVVYSAIQESVKIKEIALRISTIATTVVENAQRVGRLALAGATMLMQAPLMAVTAAQWLWNVAMNANPIALIVVGIVAFVGILVLLYNKVEPVRKVMDALFAAVKEGVIFFLKFLNPIGLIIQGFKLLYDNVKFVRDMIDGLVTAVKDAGEWLLDLVGISTKATDAEKKHAEAVEKTKAAEEARAASLEDTIKKYKELKDAQDKTVESDVDAINALKTRLRLGGEWQTLAGGQRVWVKDTEESVKQVKAAIDSWIAHGKKAVLEKKAFDKDAKETNIELGLEEDKAAAKSVDTLSAKIDKFIALQKNLVTIDAQTSITARANLRTKLDSFDKEVEGERTRVNAIKDVKEREKQLATLSSGELIRVRASLTTAIKEYDDKETALREKARLSQSSELEVATAEIKKKYAEQNIAADELRRLGLITQQEYDDAIKSHAVLSLEEIARKTKEINDKINKEQEDKLKERLDAEAKIMRQVGFVLSKNYYDTEKKIATDAINEQIKLKKKEIADKTLSETDGNAQILALRAELAKQLLAIDKDRITKEAEIQKLKIETGDGKDVDKKIASLKVDFDAETSILENQYKAKLISYEEFELKKLEAKQKFEDARLQIVKDTVQKEDAIYQAAASGITNLFGALTDQLKSIFAKWFGWEKKEKEKETETDRQLRKLEAKKREEDLATQAKESKISYEEFLLKKRKMKEDADKAEMDSEEEKVGVMQAFGETMVESTMGNLAKVAESYIQQQLLLMIADQGKATTGLIASIFSTMPWFVAVPLAAGAAGIVAGLLAGAISKISGGKTRKAAKGLVHRPDRDGRQGEMILTGEQGDTEFTAPQEDFRDYAEKDLSPMLEKVFMQKVFVEPKFKDMFLQTRQYGIIPPVSNVLRTPTATQSGVANNELRNEVKRLSAILDNLDKNGIYVKVEGTTKTKGDVLIETIRNAEKKVDNRAYVNNE